MISSGISLKPEYFDDALSPRALDARGLWFEIHAENFMVAGGPRLHWLSAIRNCHSVSMHSVGASIGGLAPLDHAHLLSLKRLADRIDPVLISEHLAWSNFDGRHFADLLPVVRSNATLERVVSHVDQLQSVLKRQIAIENPTHYVGLDVHAYSEPEFLRQLVDRTGCALLLDLNNVYVSAFNRGASAWSYLNEFPLEAVAEIHLAGHSLDARTSQTLLIDSHDQPVSEAVWALFEYVIARVGLVPTLIERDGNLPSFDELMQERDRAHAVLVTRRGSRHQSSRVQMSFQVNDTLAAA